MEREFPGDDNGEKKNDVGRGGADELVELVEEVIVALVGADHGKDVS